MSASSGMDTRPAPRSPRKRLVFGCLSYLIATVVIVVVPLVVPIGFEVGIRRISPDAVQISATSGKDGRTLASRVITDPRVVADLYTRINSLPSTNGGDYGCSLSGLDAVQYHFGFRRWGVLIEAATPPVTGCGVWSISRGGLDDPRLDTADGKQAILTAVRPLLPLPSQP